jgi:C-terminal processing protease CtpA/Prc
VNWPVLRAGALARAKEARTAADTYPALHWALAQLGDHHSFLIPAGGRTDGQTPRHSGFAAFHPEGLVYELAPGGPAERAGLRVGDVIETVDGGAPEGYGGFMRVDAGGTFVVRRGDAALTIVIEVGPVNFNRPPHGSRIGREVGYLELPTLAALHGDEEYPRRVRALIQEIDSPDVCGWIVDLRRNGGGNMWPMLEGVRPVLGEGPLGFFVPGNVPWSYPSTSGPAITVHRSNPPVAVLTSRVTASSGEALAIAFRGRALTRSFGESTFGVPTANTTFPLPDGAWLVLTTAHEADRTGRVYEGAIAPDETFPIDWRRLGADDDPLVARAADWLRGHAVCGPAVP